MRIDRTQAGSLLVLEHPLRLRLILIAFGAAVLAGVWLEESVDFARACLGVLAALLPLAGAALLERICFEFDLAQQRLRWRRSNLFRTRSGELGFGEIAEVALRVRRERSTTSPSAREAPAHYIALVTGAGELRLSDRMYADEREQAEIADAIRQALGRPARAAAAEETVEQLAAAGEVIEAIKLARQQQGLGLAEAKQLVDRLRAAAR
jgi:hypothetical protein